MIKYLEPIPSSWRIPAPRADLQRAAVSSSGGNTSQSVKPVVLNSLELIIIATGICEESTCSDRSHSSNMRPGASSSTQFNHHLTKMPTKTMAKIELCGGWAPWPSASATYRQTGWGLHQRGWLNDACATPQRRPHHEVSVDLDGFLERTALGDGFSRDRVGRATTTTCTMLAQDLEWVRNSFMAKKLLHCCICAHARAHMHFLWGVCRHLDRCFGHHTCAGVYVRQVLWTSAHTFANTLATGCAYVLMHVQFVRSALGGRWWGGSTILWKHLLLGVGVYFWQKER